MSVLTRPVSAAERVSWIDALRGFALLGIIVANLESSMLRFLLPGNGHDLGPLASLNVPFEFFESALIQGKFYSIFSFLFGLGFSIQMMRAAERGGEFGAFFRRRLAALLLIGVVHAFIWLGDILTLYALCGFVLLPFRTRSDRTILWWAFGFLVAPVAVYAVLALVNGHAATNEGPLPFDLAEIARRMTRGTVFEYLATNAFALLFRWYDLIISLRPAKVMGMFLLGLWTGRRMLHTAIELQRPLLVRLALIGLPVGLVGAGLLGWADHRGMYYEASASGVAYAAIYCVGTHVLAIGYIAAFLLLWIGRGRVRAHALRASGTPRAVELPVPDRLYRAAALLARLRPRADAAGLGIAADRPGHLRGAARGKRAVGRAPPLRPRRVGMAADDVRRRVRARQSLTLCRYLRLSGMWPSGSGLSSSR